MVRFLSSYRLLPIVLLAVGALFVLKSAGLVLDGGYTLGERITRYAESRAQQDSQAVLPPSRPTIAQADASRSWMQEIFNYPDPSAPGRSASGPALAASPVSPLELLEPIVTGSIGGETKPADAASDPVGQIAAPQVKPAADAKSTPGTKPGPAGPTPDDRVIRIAPDGMPSASERALLQSLGERRQQLEARSRELDVREAMIEQAEQRLKAALSEIKATEERIAATVQKRDEQEAERFKSVVAMYEAMKPRDAAKIFDRLDPRVLLEVAGQINPRRMSDILAKMTPANAEKLTVDLATRVKMHGRQQDPADLPKIQGRPTDG